MRRSLLAYLEDINLAILDIEDFTANKLFAEYTADRILQAAVERKFIIVGEAFAQMEQHSRAAARESPTCGASWRFAIG